MKLSELETSRATKMTAITALVDARNQAAREFTEAEATQFDALEAEVKALNISIQREKNIEALNMQKAIDKAGKETEEQKVSKRASFARAINIQMGAARMDGAEKEMDDEARNELRTSGVSSHVIKGIGFPGFMLNFKGTNVNNGHKQLNAEKRDLTSGGSHTGDDWVQTVEIGHQYGLEIAPKLFGLGVEVLAGLTSNVYITETGQATAAWATEVATAAETTPATSKPVNLAPTRLAATTDISRTLMIQEAMAEMRVRTQLSKAFNRKLDSTGINGTGVAEIPLGIIPTSGVITSVLAGGPPSRQMFLDAWAAIAAGNAPDDIKIFMTAALKAYCMGAPIDAGSGRFICENNMITGYGVEWSNNMPTGYMIIGDFSQFVVGQWGGVDLFVNPYTKSKEDTVEVTINGHFDMGCYRPTSFVIINDATTA